MDRWLRNNNVVMVVSLFLAILLWAVVHLENSAKTPAPVSPQEKEAHYNNVSIEAKYDKSRYYLESISPRTVKLTIKGNTAIDLSSTHVTLDLTNVSKGSHLVPLQANGFPAGDTVTITPPSAEVVLQEMQTKELPVQISLTGSPGNGYKASDPIIAPNRVHITVPSSMLDNIVAAKGTVSVKAATKAITTQVKLTAYDKNGKKVSYPVKPQVVDVSVPVTRPFKTVPLVIKTVGQPPSGYAIDSIKQMPDQVTLYGAQKDLDAIQFYDGLNLDVKNLTKDSSVTLSIPLKDNVLQVDPKNVVMDVNVVPSLVKTLKAVPISFVGESEGYKVTLTNPKDANQDLKLEGAPDLVDKVQNSDVQAFLDVSNLPPGDYKLPLNLNLPQYIKDAAPTINISVHIEAKKAKTNTDNTSSSTKSGSTSQSGSTSKQGTSGTSSGGSTSGSDSGAGSSPTTTSKGTTGADGTGAGGTTATANSGTTSATGSAGSTKTADTPSGTTDSTSSTSSSKTGNTTDASGTSQDSAATSSGSTSKSTTTTQSNATS